MRRLIYGIARNDVPGSARANKREQYVIWANMLKRCYSKAISAKNKTYRDISVCEEWLIFSNFKSWLDSYEYRKEGWQLDKDLLVKGNKVYGPDTCVFLPPRLNSLFVKCDSCRGNLPIGVHFDKSRLKYKVTVQNEHDKQSQKRFHTQEEAFSWYKSEKERVIKVLAESFKNQIDPRAYLALLNYQVEITD